LCARRKSGNYQVFKDGNDLPRIAVGQRGQNLLPPHSLFVRLQMRLDVGSEPVTAGQPADKIGIVPKRRQIVPVGHRRERNSAAGLRGFRA
jgi:hypothetical protein